MPAYPLFLLLGAGSALFVGMIDPIIAVYYVQVVGLGPLALVMLGTVVEVTKLLFEVPTGVVADLYGRLSVIIGVLLVGACFVLQGLLPLLVTSCWPKVLRGIGATFSSGALEGLDRGRDRGGAGERGLPALRPGAPAGRPGGDGAGGRPGRDRPGRPDRHRRGGDAGPGVFLVLPCPSATSSPGGRPGSDRPGAGTQRRRYALSCGALR